MVDQGKIMSALFTDAVLMRSLILFLMLGSIAGLIAGAALLLRPDWLMRVNKLANRWVSTRQMVRPFSYSINLESWCYRHNRLIGTLLMSAAVYIIYYLTTAFDKTAALKNVFYSASIPPLLMDGLLDGFVLFGLTGAVFAAMVSLFLVFRPSMLRDFEQRANKRTSLRQALKPLENLRGGVDQYVFRHVRLAGVLIFAGSFYTLAILLINWKNF